MEEFSDLNLNPQREGIYFDDVNQKWTATFYDEGQSYLLGEALEKSTARRIYVAALLDFLLPSAGETLNVGDFVIKRTKKEEFVLKSSLKNSESVMDAKFGNQVSVNKQTQKRKFDFLADDEEPSPILKKRRRRKKRPVPEEYEDCVKWDEKQTQWKATFPINGCEFVLGYFCTKVEAESCLLAKIDTQTNVSTPKKKHQQKPSRRFQASENLNERCIL